MNIRESAKRRLRNQARYRVTYEPDYDHEVGSGEMAEFVQGGLQRMRKYNAGPFEASQRIDDLVRLG